MDFHSLSRKELQTLCKKNKIPANITNVAMADALAALPQVEGLDKFLNPTEADAETGTPDIHHHRTACRTSTRRKGIREVPESTNVATPLHRGTRAKTVEVEQENKDSNVNVPVIPAVVPSSRRRAPAVSTRRKKEAEDDDQNGVQGKSTDLLKTTPAAAAPSSRTRAGGTSVQAAYNTRRSVRLLEKNLSMMSLLDAEDMGPAKIDDGISEEMSIVSQQTEDSSETEKVNDAGASLQTLSTVVSEKTDELEVSSLEKNTEYECQLHDLDSGSDVELASGTENDLGAGVQVESQEEAEPHDSNLKLEGKSEEMSNVSQQTEDSAETTEKVNDAGASLQTLSTVVSDKTDELEVSSLEKNTEYECQLHDLDSGSEVELASGTENDVGAGLQVESQEEAELHDSNLKLEGNSETCDDSNDVTECCDESVVDLNKSIAAREAMHADNEAGSELLSELEDSCDSSEPDNKKCLGTKQDALFVEASEDAFMKVTDQDIAVLPVVVPDGASTEVTDQDVAGFHPMSSVSDDSVNPKELVECNTGEAVHADNEAGSELLSGLEDSCDSSEPDNKKCLGTKQDALSVEASEDAFMKVTDQDIAALPVVVPDGASMEVTDQDVAGFHPMSSVSDDSVNPKELVECNTGEAVHADNEAGSELLSGLEDSCDSSEPDNKKCLGTKQDALSVEASEDAFMKVTDQDIAALPVVVPDGASMEVTDQDVAGFHPMSSVSDDSVKPKELVEFNTDNQGINEDDDNQDNNETADGNYIQNFEPMYDGKEKAADEKDLASPEWVLELGSSTFCSSGEHQEEELEAKSEHSEESRAEMENASDVTGASSAILAVEKDARSENSVAVIEVCTESSADESMDAENVTLEASLLDVGLHETEDQKEDSEKLVAEAQAEESEKHAAGEETASDAASPQIPLFHQQVSVESAGSSIDSCSSDALVSVLSYNSNTLIDGDVVPEEIAIPKQESSVSAETVTVVPIHEQKTSDIPIQLIVADHLKGESLCPAQSETEGVANEIQTVPKMISSIEDNMHNVDTMKENTTDELHNMSIRELKKKLKSLTLDGKSNCMRKTNNVVKEEVEKKRIALQALPENRMTTGEAQNDG